MTSIELSGLLHEFLLKEVPHGELEVLAGRTGQLLEIQHEDARLAEAKSCPTAPWQARQVTVLKAG